MSRPEGSAATVESKARSLQGRILTRVLNTLRNGEDGNFWVFVHLRSIALRKEGRRSIWERSTQKLNRVEQSRVSHAYHAQYRIEPDLRTYNELLITRDQSLRYQLVRFGFGGGTDQMEINFDVDEIRKTTSGLRFSQLASRRSSLLVKPSARETLADYRLSLGLGEQIRDIFGLSRRGRENPLGSRPEEVRYALQILMLWSNSFGWKTIETHHSRSSFDALSGLVITVCSDGRALSSGEAEKIRTLLEESEEELDTLVHRKINAAHDSGGPSLLSPSLRERLSIVTTRERKLWHGQDVFAVIEAIRTRLFASTFEGVPESFAFIFGHPGFIARPSEMEHHVRIPLDRIREHRELCSGALDTLNIADLLGQPESRSRIALVPIRFPRWAKQWEDAEQALTAALESLSRVHRDLIVVGVVCRNALLVYRSGEMLAVFDGAWREVLSLGVISKRLQIPTTTSSHPRLLETFRLLTRIAFGPAPRSIIVAFTVDRAKHDRLLGMSQPFGEDFSRWPPLDTSTALESQLMRASRADGAILIHADPRGLVSMTSKVRLVTPVTSGSEPTSGTGDATAQSIASQGSGVVSMKVSRDGGIKVRWEGRGPQAGSQPM